MNGYFIKKRLQHRYFPVNYEILKNTYFKKQLQTAASVHSASKLETREVRNGKKVMIHKSDDLVSGIFRSSPSEVLKKILVLNIFSNSKKMYLIKFATI